MGSAEAILKWRQCRTILSAEKPRLINYFPGMFEPKKDPSEQQSKNAYAVGLTFPKMQLQVFRLSKVRFGPEWTCDEFMTIGVWVGLLVTLLFASICVWGFCMLGNIETMDRFDDPRGKSIYVPQTD